MNCVQDYPRNRNTRTRTDTVLSVKRKISENKTGPMKKKKMNEFFRLTIGVGGREIRCRLFEWIDR